MAGLNDNCYVDGGKKGKRNDASMEMIHQCSGHGICGDINPSLQRTQLSSIQLSDSFAQPVLCNASRQ
jgi:hypothetical protein